MIYKEALWVYLVLSLVALGFDLATIRHMPRITSLVLAGRLTFIGKTLGRCFVIYLAWNALKLPEQHLGWQYWLVTVAALFAITGMFMAWYEYSHIPYGRRSTDKDHPLRRRDDGYRTRSR